MKPAVVLQTDFGIDNSVGVMFGVCRIVDPEVDVFNATHNIRQFDVLAASEALMFQYMFWPEDTIFVSVVDPGVGTERRPCIARLKTGQFVVTPDNGTLTYLKEDGLIETVREIDEPRHRFPSTHDVRIFHGRDLFAYTAAKLASGKITYEEVGEEYPLAEIVMSSFIRAHIEESGAIVGMLTHSSEHFGLVDTNIPFKWMKENGINYGDVVNVRILHRSVTLFDSDVVHERSFGYVPEGEPVLVCSETQHMEVALNMGNLVTRYGIGYGPDYVMEIRKIVL